MCGIAGYVVLDGGHAPPLKTLIKMNEMLAHRGPDDAGLHVDDGVGFAMRRLSIIDLEGGNQPVLSPGGEVMVVFNGEIYNHRELRSRLKRKGHKFRTRSDTEVLPALYLEYGTEMVEHLNGMFAVALWDFRSRTCYLFRDRFGQKPLYTGIHRGVFYFVSEAKALLSVSKKLRQLDLDAMRQYLFLGQILCPRTAFENILSLPPGHFQKIKGCKVSTPRQYWDILLHREIDSGRRQGLAEYRNEFDERFRQSVRRRLQSDVPVATTLSGGLDSSSVLYYVSELTRGKAEAFCIRFDSDDWDEEDLNESSFQDDVVRHLDIKAHRLNFFDKEQEVAAEIANAYWVYESPDSVVQQEIVFTLLSREMYRKGFKVGLGGEGADEMMRGYDWYDSSNAYLQLLGKDARLSELRQRNFQKQEAWFLERWGFPSILFQEQMNWPRIERLFDSGDLPPAFADESGVGLKRLDFQNHVPRSRFSSLCGSKLLQYADIKLRLSDFILNVQDKFSMAASVEMRSPFMDHTLAEWLVSLPPSVHRFRGREKHLFRQVMKGRLPRSVTHRRKQGYSAPFLQTEYGYNGGYLEGLLKRTVVKEFGILNDSFVSKLQKIDTELRQSNRLPARWTASSETGISIPELFLSRIADIQVFADVFINRFSEFRRRHLARHS